MASKYVTDIIDGEFEVDSDEEYSEEGYSGKTSFKQLVRIYGQEIEEEDEAEIENSVHESSSEYTGRPRHISKQDFKSKKAGRKAQWSESCTDDLVDIICNNETYQKKLISTNVKTAKNGCYYEQIIKEIRKRCLSRGENFTYVVSQTREKFKRCISECKKAALTLKTASGIKRFQEDKGYGKWFNQLLPLVQSRASCQPEEAIEPSAFTRKRREKSQEDKSSISSENSSPSSSIDASTCSPGNEEEEDTAKKMFIPTKMRRKSKGETAKVIADLVGKLTKTLEEDPTDKLIKFFENEIEKTRQHELRLFSMIFGQQNQAVSPMSYHRGAPPQDTVDMSCSTGSTGYYQTMLQQPPHLDAHIAEKQTECNTVYEQLF